MDERFLNTVLKGLGICVFAYIFNLRGFRDEISPLFEKKVPKINAVQLNVPTMNGGSTYTTSGTYSPNFGAKVKYLYDQSAVCPTASGKTTFKTPDDNNNGVIASTDRCVNCGHAYYTHR